MVDSLVNSSTSDLNEQHIPPPFQAFIPPTPPDHSFSDPLCSATDNETTYNPTSTLTTKALVEMARSQSQSSSSHQQRHTPHQTPRPTLPSIWNTPFAPQSSDSSPLTRPSTARRTSPPKEAPQMQWASSMASNMEVKILRRRCNGHPLYHLIVPHRCKIINNTSSL